MKKIYLFLFCFLFSNNILGIQEDVGNPACMPFLKKLVGESLDFCKLVFFEPIKEELKEVKSFFSDGYTPSKKSLERALVSMHHPTAFVILSKKLQDISKD